MKSNLFAAAGLALAMAGAALPAHAVILNFDLTGSRNADFQLDSNAIPDSFSTSNLIGDQFSFVNVVGTFNGAPGVATSIGFGQAPILADFQISGTSLGFTQFGGPTLFSGPGSAPIFAPGVYNLTSIVSGASTLTITDAVAAVPEPPIWAALITGLSLMGFALRRRPRRSLAAVS